MSKEYIPRHGFSVKLSREQEGVRLIIDERVNQRLTIRAHGQKTTSHQASK